MIIEIPPFHDIDFYETMVLPDDPISEVFDNIG